jgi:hypothetical protein
MLNGDAEECPGNEGALTFALEGGMLKHAVSF